MLLLFCVPLNITNKSYVKPNLFIGTGPRNYFRIIMGCIICVTKILGITFIIITGVNVMVHHQPDL